MEFFRYIRYALLAFTVTGIVASCRINEDLSVCGMFQMKYEVKLQTNVHTELRTELNTVDEVELGKRLMEELSGFFTDHAHDLNLSFYKLQPPQNLAHHEYHYIGSNSASFSIYLPAEDYRHLAIANADGEKHVQHNPEATLPSEYSLKQTVADTVDSHTIGLFSARKDIEVKGNIDQVLHVPLYMANAAAALVIYPNGNEPKKVEMFLTDLATEFSVQDSTFLFQHSPIVRTHRMADTGSDLICCYGMGFPSRDAHAKPQLTRAGANEGLWRIIVHVTMPDNRITRTVLTVPDPLYAGYLKVIKAHLMPNGALVPNRQEVGANVELDWKDGGEYNPII